VVEIRGVSEDGAEGIGTGRLSAPEGTQMVRVQLNNTYVKIFIESHGITPAERYPGRLDDE
jgi:hypothetical protein